MKSQRLVHIRTPDNKQYQKKGGGGKYILTFTVMCRMKLQSLAREEDLVSHWKHPFLQKQLFVMLYWRLERIR